MQGGEERPRVQLVCVHEERSVLQAVRAVAEVHSGGAGAAQA